MHNLILTKAQAEAVYSAMSSLECVHLRAWDLRFGNGIISADFNGVIRIIGTAIVVDERYADLDAFSDAYGLNT